MEDKHFHEIIEELQPGDALVMNNTRGSAPARLYGEKTRYWCAFRSPSSNEYTRRYVGDIDQTCETCQSWDKRISFGDGRLQAVVKRRIGTRRTDH